MVLPDAGDPAAATVTLNPHHNISKIGWMARPGRPSSTSHTCRSRFLTIPTAPYRP
jgi:hypothetical protein